MINVESLINGGISVAKKVGTGALTFIKSDTAKKLSLSAVVGAAGVLGQKGAEKLCSASANIATKAKAKEEERRSKKIEENIKSWDGMSCEDMI